MENFAPKPKWYYGLWTVISALVLLGPFAFPLLWKSPRFNLLWKVLLTILFTLATVYMILGSWKLFEVVLGEYRRAGLL